MPNVGIGTTSPTGTFEVQGGTAASGNGTNVTVQAQAGQPSGNTYGGKIKLIGGAQNGTGKRGSVIVGPNDLGSDAALEINGNNNDYNGGISSTYWLGASGISGVGNAFGLHVNQVGTAATGTAVQSTVSNANGILAGAHNYRALLNVNSGTISTRYGYSVNDSAGAASTNIGTQYGLYVNSLVNATNNYAVYTDGATKSYFGGTVGVGTTSPKSILDLTATGTNSALLVPRDTTANRPAGNVTNGMIRYNTDDAKFEFYQAGAWVNFASGSGSGSAFTQGGNAFGQVGTLGTTDTTNLNIVTNNANRMTVTSAGNVGIGTDQPSERLAVAGNATVSGRIVAGVATDADALTALTVDFSNTNMVRATAGANDCGTLNFTNVAAGGSYTVTIPAATKTCTVVHLNGATTNVKLPSGYGAGGETCSGVVYTAVYDGTTLWVSYVPF